MGRKTSFIVLLRYPHCAKNLKLLTYIWRNLRLFCEKNDLQGEEYSVLPLTVLTYLRISFCAFENALL